MRAVGLCAASRTLLQWDTINALKVKLLAEKERVRLAEQRKALAKKGIVPPPLRNADGEEVDTVDELLRYDIAESMNLVPPNFFDPQRDSALSPSVQKEMEHRQIMEEVNVNAREKWEENRFNKIGGRKAVSKVKRATGAKMRRYSALRSRLIEIAVSTGPDGQ